jgi:anti-anti-sigma factor
MATVVRCPYCAKSYRISAEVVGRRVQCRNCGEMFEAGAAPPADAPPAAAAQVANVPDVASAAGSRPHGTSLPHGSVAGPLEVRHTSGVAVVRVLAARIDSENVEEIGAALLALADDPANKRMVLNLAPVEFLFSTALGKLVALEKKLQSKRGSLRLCELRPLVHESLDSAGLTLILQVFDTEQQALAAKY